LFVLRHFGRKVTNKSLIRKHIDRILLFFLIIPPAYIACMACFGWLSDKNFVFYFALHPFLSNFAAIIDIINNHSITVIT